MLYVLGFLYKYIYYENCIPSLFLIKVIIGFAGQNARKSNITSHTFTGIFGTYSKLESRESFSLQGLQYVCTDQTLLPTISRPNHRFYRLQTESSSERDWQQKNMTADYTLHKSFSDSLTTHLFLLITKQMLLR